MRNKKSKDHQIPMGMLFLIDDEISGGWNILLDKDKNMGLPPDKADPQPEEQDKAKIIRFNPVIPANQNKNFQHRPRIVRIRKKDK